MEKDTQTKPLSGVGIAALFSGQMATALVFAARYTHPRNTGGTWAVVRALEQCWHVLDHHTRDQILRESKEAEYNREDWNHLRKFADDYSENVDVEARPESGANSTEELIGRRPRTPCSPSFESMKTIYVTQKRHPNLGNEWPHREWHDRAESSPHSHKEEAIKETKRLILNAETTQYRLIKRTDEEIPLENAELRRADSTAPNPKDPELQ